MKKIKQTGILLLSMLLILCVQFSSMVFAAQTPVVPVGDDEVPVEAGDILYYCVDLKSPVSIGEMCGTVYFNESEASSI